MKSTITNISEDGRFLIKDIQGSIKKISINSSEPLSNVTTTFITAESETMFEVDLMQPTTIIYPWNFQDPQGRGAEYYSYGDVGIIIEGLMDGQEIESISIFYS